MSAPLIIGTLSYILINRLVLENLKNRPVRTFVSALAIGAQVTMVLTLAGISRGMVGDAAQRARGVGADVVIRPPYSSLFSFSGSFPDGILAVAAKTYDVKLAMGVLVYSIGGVDTITGIDQAKFDAMSGGFHYLEGRPLRDANDILVDDYYARANHLHAGYKYELINRTWNVAAVVEHGKMSRIFASLAALQTLTANTGRLTCIYIKASKPERIKGVMRDLGESLPEYKLYSLDELVSQWTATNVPMLQAFTGVVIGIGAVVGWLVVFLSMYTAVVERTREIGIMKALGASPRFVLNILLRETVLLALAGSVLGIAMSYGARLAIGILVPTMIQAHVPDWWPIAAAIAVAGAILGAAYPGWMAARQEVVDALAYE